MADRYRENYQMISSRQFSVVLYINIICILANACFILHSISIIQSTIAILLGEAAYAWWTTDFFKYAQEAL